MTDFPTPSANDRWGAQLNAAIAERFEALAGATLAVDEADVALVGGVPLRLAVVWKSGDPDPTAGGTLPLPGDDVAFFIAALTPGDTLPAFLDGRDVLVVEQDAPTVTYLIRADFADLADESAVIVGTQGTGDTTVAVIAGASPTVETGDAVLTPAIESASAGGASAAGFTLPAATSQGRYGFWVKTPAAWPSASFSLFALYLGNPPGGSNCVRLVLGGTSSPGEVRVQQAGFTNAATWAATVATDSYYWIDLRVDQTADTVDLLILNQAGGTVLEAAGVSCPAGIGDTHDTVMLGNQAAVTVAYLIGHLRAAEAADLATPITPAALP